VDNKKTEKFVKEFNISLSHWTYEKLKEYAKANEISIRAAVRVIITQFIKEHKPFI
jgi:hypothetical protein